MTVLTVLPEYHSWSSPSKQMLSLTHNNSRISLVTEVYVKCICQSTQFKKGTNMNSKMQLLPLFICNKFNYLYIHTQKAPKYLCLVYQHLNFKEKKQVTLLLHSHSHFYILKMIDIITSSFQKSLSPLSSMARLVK